MVKKKHHEKEAQKKEHHKKRDKHKKSKGKHHAKHHQKKHGLFSKVSMFFREAVKVPTPESEVQETVEEHVPIPEMTPEPKSEPIPVVKFKDLPKIPTELPEDVREEVVSEHAPEMTELLDNLHAAAENWKKSGELGVHFEPPVSLRERISGFLGKLKRTPVTIKLEKKSREVTEKVVERVAKEESKGNPVKPEKIIKEEWADVMERVQKAGTSKEREEIEKIYKQLEEN